jgi:hypothetical protein
MSGRQPRGSQGRRTCHPAALPAVEAAVLQKLDDGREGFAHPATRSRRSVSRHATRVGGAPLPLHRRQSEHRRWSPLGRPRRQVAVPSWTRAAVVDRRGGGASGGTAAERTLALAASLLMPLYPFSTAGAPAVLYPDIANNSPPGSY